MALQHDCWYLITSTLETGSFSLVSVKASKMPSIGALWPEKDAAAPPPPPSPARALTRAGARRRRAAHGGAILLMRARRCSGLSSMGLGSVSRPVAVARR